MADEGQDEVRTHDPEVRKHEPPKSDHIKSTAQYKPFPRDHPTHGHERVMSDVSRDVDNKKRKVAYKKKAKKDRSHKGRVEKHAKSMFSGSGKSGETNKTTLALLAGAAAVVFLMMKR